MCPRVGFSKPSSILMVVDFPEPLGPSRPKTSPRRTSKSTLSTARALGRPQKSLKILVKPRTATTTSADCGLRIADCGDASRTAGIIDEIQKRSTQQFRVPSPLNGERVRVRGVFILRII